MTRKSMIRDLSLASSVFATLMVASPSASAQDVSVDYDRQANFSKCSTYAWAKGQPAPSPLADKRIVDAIDAALAAKGWKKVDRDPGCYVAYQASLREQKSLQVWQPTGWRFGGGIGSVDVKTVLAGMLLVDIGDAATQQLIFRAIAKDTVSDKPEKNQKKLAKTVEKMFKELPSGSARS
jgi:Domain of unknown function (DUF4136)